MNRIVKIKKRLFDRVSAFLMVMLVILNATFMVPVHAAFVGPIAVDSEVAVASALAALGIGVSGNVSTPDWLAFLQKIGSGIDQKIFGGITAEQRRDATVYHLTHDFLSAVNQSLGDFVHTAENGQAITQNFPVSAMLSGSGLDITTQQMYDRMGFSWASGQNYSSFSQHIASYSVIQQVWASYWINYWSSPVDCTVNMLGQKYFVLCGTNICSPTLYVPTDDKKTYPLGVKEASNQIPHDYFLRQEDYVDNSHQALMGYLVSYSEVGSSIVHYICLNIKGSTHPLEDYNYRKYYTYFPMIDDTSANAVIPYSPTDNARVLPKISAQGASVLTKPYADVQSKLDQKAGVKDNTGAYTGVDVKVPVGVDSKNPSKLRDATSTQTKVVGQEVADETDKTADDTYNQTNNKDTTPPRSASMPSLELPTGLQKKFPFCLPWDLAAIYKLFNVTPKAPVWTIPINIDQGYLHVHQTYTYDLNQNNVLDTVLPIFKWFLNVSFCIGLILITKRIMT